MWWGYPFFTSIKHLFCQFLSPYLSFWELITNCIAGNQTNYYQSFMQVWETGWGCFDGYNSKSQTNWRGFTASWSDGQNIPSSATNRNRKGENTSDCCKRNYGSWAYWLCWLAEGKTLHSMISLFLLFHTTSNVGGCFFN